jgi:hypothetical protein
MPGDNVTSCNAMETLIERIRSVKKPASLGKIVQLVVPKKLSRAAIGGCHA